LPRKLGETEVLIDGKAAPLIYVSPDQINLQLSSGQAAGQVLADLRVGGRTVGRAPVTVVPNAPGIFVVANQDGRVNAPALPAHRGEVLQIFGTGQGAVLPAVDDGAAAPSQPVSNSLAQPNAFPGRPPAFRGFSGLAPGFAGLWQLNVLIPRDAPTGPALALTVVNGLTSNRVSVTVVV
jgi:adhesin/invasin